MMEARIRSSLQGRMPHTPMNDDEIRQKAGKLWHETGGQTVMVRLDWLKNDLDRQYAENIGNMMFGKAKKEQEQHG
jgi:hypothetical protein